MTSPSRIDAVPVTGRLLREAVGRILGSGSAPPEAITQFMRRAPDLGIDLTLMVGVVSRGPTGTPCVRQSCLPVVGAGATAMVFLSGPGPARVCGTSEIQSNERAAAVEAALDGCWERHGEGVRLAQALTEPHEVWAHTALEAAGFQRIADLAYLGRDLKLGEAAPLLSKEDRTVRDPGGPWPEGIAVRALRSAQADEAALRRALEASYEATLDCPELAGLRRITDIIASHKAVGRFDPDLWWIVEREGTPEGCVLLNHCPDQACTELVYIGISPLLRGLGLGHRLLRCAIAAAAGRDHELRCAVDMRNHPARRMYDRAGFEERGQRRAFVAPLSTDRAAKPLSGSA